MFILAFFLILLPALLAIAAIDFLLHLIQRRREQQKLLKQQLRMHAEMLQAARQMCETANRYAQEDPVVYDQSEDSQQ